MLIGYCISAAWKLTKIKTESLFRSIAAGIGMGVFGFLVAGQFVTVSYYPFLWVHLAFIVCLTKITRVSALQNR